MHRKTDKKAQSKVGDLFIGVILFLTVLLTGFLGYASFLTDNDVDLSDVTGIENITIIYNQGFNISNNKSTIYDVEEKSDGILAVAGLDFLTTGADAIKAGFNITSQLRPAISYIYSNTALKYINEIFYYSIISIVIIAVVFIIIGAIWRFDMKK